MDQDQQKQMQLQQLQQYLRSQMMGAGHLQPTGNFNPNMFGQQQTQAQGSGGSSQASHLQGGNPSMMGASSFPQGLNTQLNQFLQHPQSLYGQSAIPGLSQNLSQQLQNQVGLQSQNRGQSFQNPLMGALSQNTQGQHQMGSGQSGFQYGVGGQSHGAGLSQPSLQGNTAQQMLYNNLMMQNPQPGFGGATGFQSQGILSQLQGQMGNNPSFQSLQMQKVQDMHQQNQLDSNRGVQPSAGNMFSGLQQTNQFQGSSSGQNQDIQSNNQQIGQSTQGNQSLPFMNHNVHALNMMNQFQGLSGQTSGNQQQQMYQNILSQNQASSQGPAQNQGTHSLGQALGAQNQQLTKQPSQNQYSQGQNQQIPPGGLQVPIPSSKPMVGQQAPKPSSESSQAQNNPVLPNLSSVQNQSQQNQNFFQQQNQMNPAPAAQPSHNQGNLSGTGIAGQVVSAENNSAQLGASGSVMNAANLNKLAEYCATNGDYNSAIEYYLKLTTIDPDSGAAWTALGHCYLLIEDLQKSFNAYQHALYSLEDIKDPQLWYGIGILYEKFESYDHAISALIAVLKMSPNFYQKSEVLYKLGMIFAKTNQIDQAISYFQNSILTNTFTVKRKVDTLLKIGLLYEENKDFTQAQRSYEAALNHDDQNFKIYQHLAWSYFLQGNINQALEYVKKAEKKNKGQADTHYILGRCYMCLENTKEALENFQQAAYKNPGEATYWATLAIFYYNNANYTDAFDNIIKATTLNSTMSEIWFNLGVLYEKCKQPEEALIAYQKVLEIENEDPETTRRIAAIKNTAFYMQEQQNNKINIPMRYPKFTLPNSLSILKKYKKQVNTQTNPNPEGFQPPQGNQNQQSNILNLDQINNTNQNPMANIQHILNANNAINSQLQNNLDAGVRNHPNQLPPLDPNNPQPVQFGQEQFQSQQNIPPGAESNPSGLEFDQNRQQMNQQQNQQVQQFQQQLQQQQTQQPAEQNSQASLPSMAQANPLNQISNFLSASQQNAQQQQQEEKQNLGQEADPAKDSQFQSQIQQQQVESESKSEKPEESKQENQSEKAAEENSKSSPSQIIQPEAIKPQVGFQPIGQQQDLGQKLGDLIKPMDNSMLGYSQGMPGMAQPNFMNQNPMLMNQLLQAQQKPQMQPGPMGQPTNPDQNQETQQIMQGQGLSNQQMQMLQQNNFMGMMNQQQNQPTEQKADAQQTPSNDQLRQYFQNMSSEEFAQFFSKQVQQSKFNQFNPTGQSSFQAPGQMIQQQQTQPAPHHEESQIQFQFGSTQQQQPEQPQQQEQQTPQQQPAPVLDEKVPSVQQESQDEGKDSQNPTS